MIQTPPTTTDEERKIRMYAGQVRQSLTSLAAALARLATLKRSPTLNILSKTADTWRIELEKELE